MNSKARNSCALCQQNSFLKLTNFPSTPIANQLLEAKGSDQERYPLNLLMCNKCRHIQIDTIVDPAILFANYPYVSNSSQSMENRLVDLANEYIARFDINDSSFVLEIGSNDGFLLSRFQETGCKVLGVDPAINATNVARAKGIPTLVDFFTSDLAKKIKAEDQSPTLIIANNVLAHSDYLPDIFSGVSSLMSSNTIAVIEFSYVVDIFEKLLFDTIYHEHTSYHSIEPLVAFLESFELEIVDVERFDAHGGSARIFLAKKISGRIISPSVQIARDYERSIGIHEIGTWEGFNERLRALKQQFSEIMHAIKKSKETLAGYGVPAKFTTLFHVLGFAECDFQTIADDNPMKVGKFAPGTSLVITATENLPIVDNLIIFSWNYSEEIVSKLHTLQKVKKRVIIPLPDFTIIDY